jgi:hypothetical protein
MSFEFKGATITARELTIAEDDQINRLFAVVAKIEPGATASGAQAFCEFQIAAEIEGDFFIPRVTHQDEQETIAEAWRAWRKAPRRLLTLWERELLLADNPNPNPST